MAEWNPEDRVFEALAGYDAAGVAPAPSRLKSRIYSALVQRQAESGRLQSLTGTRAAGQALCCFEELVRIAPVGENARSLNICRVCHARVLGENVENAPIWWPHCPYVRFQNR